MIKDKIKELKSDIKSYIKIMDKYKDEDYRNEYVLERVKNLEEEVIKLREEITMFEKMSKEDEEIYAMHMFKESNANEQYWIDYLMEEV